MTVTLATARTNARSRLNEATAGFWADAELTVWINSAVADVARRTEYYQQRTDIAAVAGTQEYALPTSLIRLNRVEYTPTGSTAVHAITFRDVNNMDEVWWTAKEETRGQVPAYYTLWGSPPSILLILWPIPATTGTITVWYYGQPTAVTVDGTALAIPEGWEDLVYDYVEYNALRKAKDQRWQEAKTLYEEHVAELFDKSRRWTDQAGAISTGYSGAYLPAWLTNGW